MIVQTPEVKKNEKCDDNLADSRDRNFAEADDS